MKNLYCLSRLLLLCGLLSVISFSVFAEGYHDGKNFIPSDDYRIVYMGRISKRIPHSILFTYPGVSIYANFEGTTLQMKAKPGSGSFMVEIDDELPYRINFSRTDSIMTLAEGLSDGVHNVRIMYAIEGYELKPEFKGFYLDSGCSLAEAPILPERRMEFIGNSITCGYGVESENPSDPFTYETENHFYTYAARTARALNAQHYVVARSGIGVYRNYGASRSLPDIVSDNMVLQQQSEACLWGKAKPNTKVKIRPSWNSKTYTVTSDSEGKWIAKINTPEASYNTYTISISDGEEVKLNNILVGEVWFCSGQSNMEMPLRGFWNCPIEGANETIATASKWKGIRVATIEKNGQLEPVDNCKGSWKVSNPENAPAFSATAFNFAMMVNQVLDIPVGIINCSWGGTTVEGWLPREIVSQYPDIDLERDIRNEDGHEWWHYLSPILMYNGMLKPLQNYTIKGFLWYQGESNVGKHKTYAERMKTMVDLWRKEWGLGELPFYYVELAPYKSTESYDFALLREAQFKAQSIISNSAMISTNDLVEPYEMPNVHPKNKTDVGKRLAYMALSKTYEIPGIEAYGPVYKSMEIKDGAAILSFDHAQEGFNRMAGMEGFEVAGSDRVFYPAEAEVYNNLQIKVTCDKVPVPVAVRYGFRDYKPGNVANLRELPLYPFRTDNWE